MLSRAGIKSVFLTYLQGYAPVTCLQINLSTFWSDPESEKDAKFGLELNLWCCRP